MSGLPKGGHGWAICEYAPLAGGVRLDSPPPAVYVPTTPMLLHPTFTLSRRPSAAGCPPIGGEWIYEIKHDGRDARLPNISELTAWQYAGATLRRPLKTIEGARNATDHERINARPCSDCARSNGPVRELWPRGLRRH
jgi:hypothetical protein